MPELSGKRLVSDRVAAQRTPMALPAGVDCFSCFSVICIKISECLKFKGRDHKIDGFTIIGLIFIILSQIEIMQLFARIDSEIKNNEGAIFVGRDIVLGQIPLHQHQQHQMLIVENGIAHLKTPLSSYYVPSKHYLWIPKGTDHWMEYNIGKPLLKSIYFTEGPDTPEHFYNSLGVYPINSLLKEMLNHTREWYGTIVKGSKQHGFLLTLKHLLPEISKTPLHISLPFTTHQRLAPVLDFMAVHKGQELSLPYVAEKFGFSVRNLTRIFDWELKVSYVQYLKILRVIAAMQLLSSAGKNITETAYEVGYTSVAAFSNSFKEVTNMRPNEFRRLAGD